MTGYGWTGRALLMALHCWAFMLPAQNLILNPGFEDGGVEAAHYPDPSPDRLSLDASGTATGLPQSVFGRIQPFEGRSVMGATLWSKAIPDFREYITLELSEPLEKGETYTCSFYLANGVQTAGTAGGYGIGGLGVHFSEEKPVQRGCSPLDARPQFALEDRFYSREWRNVRFSFQAEGPHRHIAVGNFADDARTAAVSFAHTAFPSAYYFFDGFELVKGSPHPPANPAAPAPVDAGVDISESQAPLEETCRVFIPSAFSPNGDGVNDFFEVHSPCQVTDLRMQIFDQAGKQVFFSTGPSARWDGLGAPAGMYFYRIEVTLRKVDDLHRRLHTGPLSLK